LSPAYDVNPTPAEIKPRILSTLIDYESDMASIETALSVTDEFRLSREQAEQIMHDVAEAVSNWRNVAAQFDLSKREIDRMASAFEHEDLDKAKRGHDD
jgi:serine/threonine-protein kinase HipA